MKANADKTSRLQVQADGLAATVRALLPSLTPSVTRVARMVLEDPLRVSRSTISELSQLTATSESTIVRAARSLGFEGYPELRLALAAASARQEDELEIGDRDIAATDSVADVIRKIASAEAEAIQNTAVQVDAAQLKCAVDAIAAARRIDVYGIWASGLVAMDLQQKLGRIGLFSHAYTDFHLAIGSAVLLQAEDVAVAVSYSGETADVLEPMRQASQSGATTVAITSHPRSPVALAADIVLVCGVRETAFRPGAMASRISQLVIVDCIFVGVAQRRFGEASEALRRTHEAVSSRRSAARRGS